MVVVADVADYKAMWCCAVVLGVIYQGGAHQEISLQHQAGDMGISGFHFVYYWCKLRKLSMLINFAELSSSFYTYA